jgi:N4-gp56 family major capsid protein
MANTTFGTNHPLARKIWSEKLFREALKETYIGKFLGTTSNSLIQTLTEPSKGAGDTVYAGLRMQLSGYGVAGDDTLEGQEEALTFYRDTLTIDQIRNAVRSQGKASEQRVPYSMREEARQALGDWISDMLDTSFFNQIAGNTAESDTRRTGNNATVAPTAAFKLIANSGAAGSASTEASLSTVAAPGTNALLKLGDIDRAVALAKTASPLMRPIKMGGDDFYVMFLHPYQVWKLRQDTNTGQWADLQKAALQGGQGSANPLWSGALGMYNNVILHESTRVPTTVDLATNTNFRRAIFCGAQAAVMAFGQGNSGMKTSWAEELFDYGNQLGVAAGLIFGIKKSVYNSADFATITISSYAPAP